MGTMKFEANHALSKDEAKKRITQLIDYWGTKYGVTTTWSGDTAKFAGKVMGVSIDGKLDVTETKVAGEGADPGILFRSKAKSYLQQKLTEALDPAGYRGKPD